LKINDLHQLLRLASIPPYHHPTPMRHTKYIETNNTHPIRIIGYTTPLISLLLPTLFFGCTPLQKSDDLPPTKYPNVPTMGAAADAGAGDAVELH
jgi:hypothetical protein